MLRLAACIISLCLGCTFDSRSGAFSCDSESECQDGRVCMNGWCVIETDPESVLADAGGGTSSDGALAEADAAITACSACSGSCNQSCGSSSCILGCDGTSCTCELSCVGADFCETSCSGSTNCSINCTGTGQCNVNCKNTSCEVDCTGGGDCSKFKCQGDTACLITCIGADSCAFSECAAGATSCPGSVIVCNRACP